GLVLRGQPASFAGPTKQCSGSVRARLDIRVGVFAFPHLDGWRNDSFLDPPIQRPCRDVVPLSVLPPSLAATAVSLLLLLPGRSALDRLRWLRSWRRRIADLVRLRRLHRVNKNHFRTHPLVSRSTLSSRQTKIGRVKLVSARNARLIGSARIRVSGLNVRQLKCSTVINIDRKETSISSGLFQSADARSEHF